MYSSKVRAAVIGKDGRTSAIKKLLESSPRIIGEVVTLSSGKGLDCVSESVTAARAFKPDFVVVGPEEPLAYGVVDALQQEGIPAVGPSRFFAQLESSKSFSRRLLATHSIPGNPRFAVFQSLDGIEDYLRTLREFVIKPDGLTGGKGVKVWGDHLNSIEQALDYCTELLSLGQSTIVIEEKLDGEEFSLQSFCDGSTVKHTVPVQDHKRAFDGDTGPNTGGMGSYSCADHSLPFLSSNLLSEARRINELVAKALGDEFCAKFPDKTPEKYKGVLFGGFMVTKDGIRVLEYNARFGDPEALNVLSLLETDLCDVFQAIIDERLHEVPVTFRAKATVCKYVVPELYPMESMSGELNLSRVPNESDNFKMYFASVDPVGEDRTVVRMTGSRALAMVGIGNTLEEANQIAERGAASVDGRVRHRTDIGTAELIERRVHHMSEVAGRPLLAQ